MTWPVRAVGPDVPDDSQRQVFRRYAFGQDPVT